MSILKKLWAPLYRFAKAERGNVSMMAGLSIIPLLVAGGAAVDYERAVNTKTGLSMSLDETALYAATLPDTTNSALTSKSQIYLTSNWPTTGGATMVDFSVVNNGPSVTATSHARIPNFFMSLVGIPTTTIIATSTVVKNGGALEVSMVLDNTGSMGGGSGKIEAEIASSVALINQFQALAGNNGNLFVSLVPFDATVNVGVANKNAAWVTGSPTSTWNGCVWDRGDAGGPNVQNYDTNVSPPTPGVPASLYQARNNTTCPQQTMGLNNNWSAIKTVLNAMAPNLNTNQNIGLQMGWMSLTGGGPYTVPVLPPITKLKKAVILLTDGLNTQNRWTTNQGSIDARENLTCANMKAGGIIVYTLQLDTAAFKDGQSPVLKSCASDNSKYFYLTNPNQVGTAFTSIGNDLGQIYISN